MVGEIACSLEGQTDGMNFDVFVGDVVANTDGVWLSQTPTARFPAGAFFAVHDEQGIAAFDWRDIATALNLNETCLAVAQ